MNEGINDDRRVLLSLLSSIKLSVDRGMVVKDDQSLQEVRNIIMRLEGVRYLITSSRRAHYRMNQANFDQILREIKDIREHLYFKKNIGRLPIRALASESLPPLSFLVERKSTIDDALNIFTEVVETTYLKTSLDLFDNAPTDSVRLRNMVPPQKVAPVQFDVKDGRLILAPKLSSPLTKDMKSVQSARETLIENGKRIIENLKNSNCDIRLIENIELFQEKLSSDYDVIQLGILNIGCEMMCSTFEQELPSAVLAMLRAQTSGVGLFVAQFPEWTRFSENAAQAELNTDDIVRISDTALRLVTDLRNSPQFADPEVPRTIAFLQSFIADPKRGSRRAAYAVIRTIENLIAKVFSYGANFFDDTISQTCERGSKIASQVIMVGLLTLAIEGAAGLSPVAAKLGDSAWMSNAAEIVKRQIQSLKSE